MLFGGPGLPSVLQFARSALQAVVILLDCDLSVLEEKEGRG